MVQTANAFVDGATGQPNHLGHKVAKLNNKVA